MDARSSPTLTLVLVTVAVFACQVVFARLGGNPWVFALVWPVGARPWALATATFAHGSLSHLLANLVPLVLAGVLIERRASSTKFYLFVFLVGAIAALAQVFVEGFVFGARPYVLGASGAVFGLIGYLLAGNRLTDRVVAGISLSPRVQMVGFVVLAAAVTLLTAKSGVALISHFTGFLLGLIAGRAGLLRASRPSAGADPGPRI